MDDFISKPCPLARYSERFAWSSAARQAFRVPVASWPAGFGRVASSGLFSRVLDQFSLGLAVLNIKPFSSVTVKSDGTSKSECAGSARLMFVTL